MGHIDAHARRGLGGTPAQDDLLTAAPRAPVPSLRARIVLAERDLPEAPLQAYGMLQSAEVSLHASAELEAEPSKVSDLREDAARIFHAPTDIVPYHFPVVEAVANQIADPRDMPEFSLIDPDINHDPEYSADSEITLPESPKTLSTFERVEGDTRNLMGLAARDNATNEADGDAVVTARLSTVSPRAEIYAAPASVDEPPASGFDRPVVKSTQSERPPSQTLPIIAPELKRADFGTHNLGPPIYPSSGYQAFPAHRLASEPTFEPPLPDIQVLDATEARAQPDPFIQPNLALPLAGQVSDLEMTWPKAPVVIEAGPAWFFSNSQSEVPAPDFSLPVNDLSMGRLPASQTALAWVSPQPVAEPQVSHQITKTPHSAYTDIKNAGDWTLDSFQPASAGFTAAMATPAGADLSTQTGSLLNPAIMSRLQEVVPKDRAVDQAHAALTLSVAAGSSSPAPRAPLLPAMATSVWAQVIDAMNSSAMRSFQVQLAPIELGRVRITMNSTEAGVQVIIFAERPETLELLRKFAANFEKELTDIGYQHLDLTFSQQQDSRQQFQGSIETGDRDQVTESVPISRQIIHMPDARIPGGMDIRV